MEYSKLLDDLADPESTPFPPVRGSLGHTGPDNSSTWPGQVDQRVTLVFWTEVYVTGMDSQIKSAFTDNVQKMAHPNRRGNSPRSFGPQGLFDLSALLTDANKNNLYCNNVTNKMS